MKSIIVREYIESLKEDAELDYLFPMLLEVMGFQILDDASNSKGLNQYGKDLVAIGKDEDGIEKKFYFELKGGKDKNITNSTLHKKDGILESLREAKLVDFSANSIANFENLPLKIILVHNGILKANTRQIFEGFIEKEILNDGSVEFDRWDISKLTNLFSEYLFGEYLLTGKENIRLFKRFLVFFDVPENSQSDFKKLIQLILTDASNVKIKAKSRLPVKINVTI